MINKISNHLVTLLLKLPPSENTRIASFCQRYVDRYNGDNNDDIYSNGEWHFLRRIVPMCDIIFDVGANQGDWTELAFALKADVNIHSFEPSQATFRKLLSRGFPQNV